MDGSIIHRGPDDNGMYNDGKCAMGMRRLSIIDLGGGKQPIANEDGRYHIVFNGEIYNYQALREGLSRAATPSRRPATPRRSCTSTKSAATPSSTSSPACSASPSGIARSSRC